MTAFSTPAHKQFKKLHNMKQPAKTKVLNIRVSEEDYKAIQDKMKQLKLETPRKRNNFLRWLILNDEQTLVPNEANVNNLIQSFEEMLNVGGRLNQVSHQINRKYIEIVNLDKTSIQVDGGKILKILNNIETCQARIMQAIQSFNYPSK